MTECRTRSVRGMAFLATLALALPTGAAFADAQQVFPEVVFRTSTEVNTVPGDFRLVTLVLRFEPGAWTPLHFHGGDGLVTVLEGVMTLRLLGQEANPYRPGDSWTERVGMPHEAGNDGDEPALLAVTFILPAGAPTTVAID